MKPVEAIYSLGVSHNKFALPLPDGTFYPEYGAKGDVRPLEFISHFNRVRDKAWTDCTFLDLGCSEGSTTFGLSQMASTVYGVEGRADGIDRANVLRDIIGFDRTHFAVGNVVDDSSYRPVDGIFNAGVLYHLEDPLRCLEQCAANARLFVYVDTGHMPRSEAERTKAKFFKQFGASYKIEWRGLSLDAMNFAEPSVPELANGVRRGPRSGIGNTNSVWLTHRSLVDAMAALGFPHHLTVADIPKIPRLRTAFFRAEPRAMERLDPLALPLPNANDPKPAALNARRRDIDYLKKTGQPVLVVGREPMLQAIVSDLRQNQIAVGEVLTLPGEGLPRRVLMKLLAGKSGIVVAAAPVDYYAFSYQVALMDGFKNVFTSFAMSLPGPGA